MRNLRELKVRHYAARMTDINEYLAILQVPTKIEILPHIMPICWINQVFVHGFDFKPVLLKKSINTFKSMELTEMFYEGVMKHSYNKYTRLESIHNGYIRKMRRRATLSKSNPDMG